MQTIYVCFTDKTKKKISSYWGSPQDPSQLNENGSLSFPFYEEILSDDLRYVTWFNSQAGQTVSFITDSYTIPKTS